MRRSLNGADPSTLDIENWGLDIRFNPMLYTLCICLHKTVKHVNGYVYRFAVNVYVSR